MQGIENYSRHMDGRASASSSATLLDFFPTDWLLIIDDESHQTIPQVSAMWHGDRSRSVNLVEHGFRLPSAPGQPASALRGVRAEDAADHLRVSHPGPI